MWTPNKLTRVFYVDSWTSHFLPWSAEAKWKPTPSDRRHSRAHQDVSINFLPSLKFYSLQSTTLTPSFVHQYDEELSEIKKVRRPGRPASTREDLLKVKIDKLEKEHQNGFRQCIYNLSTEVHLTNVFSTPDTWWLRKCHATKPLGR